MKSTIFLLAIGISLAAAKSVHIGCFEDHHDYARLDRDMPWGYEGNITGMTVDYCVAHCKKLGYDYAGLQDGFECWCGDKFGAYGTSHACSMPCVGDPSQICGGAHANDVYTANADPGKVKACTKEDCVMAGWGPYGQCMGECGKGKGLQLRYRNITTRAWCGGKACGDLRDSMPCTRPEPCTPPQPYTLMGCYKDNSLYRVLPEAPLLLNKETMTIGKCIKHCYRRSYDFAGLEFGFECWCGMKSHNYKINGPGVCNVPCKGDPKTFCGGGLAVSVFSTVFDYKCKKSDCQVAEWDDWTECSGECGQNKGIQERRRMIKLEKECGGADCPAVVEKRPCTVGRKACPGPNYIGCFKDSHDRDLAQAHAEFKVNIADNCVIHCRNKGFAYAGVTMQECWCGNGYGKHGPSKCGFTCPDGTGARCGGEWANSIFKTSLKTDTEQVDCTNTEAVDCVMGDWGEFGPGDYECFKYRSRKILTPSKCGGKACGATQEGTRSDRNEYKCKVIREMYKGCWRDGARRDLPNGPFKHKYMTPGRCIYTCKEKGYLFAGPQMGDECWCGNEFGKHGRSYRCDLHCPGDQLLYCGGGWANSLFLTTEPPKPTTTPTTTTTTTPKPTTTTTPTTTTPTTTPDPCAEDCVTGPWSQYGKCVGECGEGNGIQIRYRKVLKPTRGSGRPCTISQSVTCTVKDCKSKNQKIPCPSPHLPGNLRVDGGWADITKAECEARGHCFDDSVGKNFHHCYKQPEKVTGKEPLCPWQPAMAAQQRRDAGFPGITPAECVDSGNCWDKSCGGNCKWCYVPPQ